jgi:hypothetical protein
MRHTWTHGFVVDDLVRRDGFRLFVNFVGDTLWCRSSIRHIVFDAKIGIRASRVMASSQENSAVRLVLPDDVRRSGRRQDGILPDNELLHTIRGSDFEDCLDCFW